MFMYKNLVSFFLWCDLTHINVETDGAKYHCFEFDCISVQTTGSWNELAKNWTDVWKWMLVKQFTCTSQQWYNAEFNWTCILHFSFIITDLWLFYWQNPRMMSVTKLFKSDFHPMLEIRESWRLFSNIASDWNDIEIQTSCSFPSFIYMELNQGFWLTTKLYFTWKIMLPVHQVKQVMYMFNMYDIYTHKYIWGLWCRKQLSQAGINNCIPQYSVGCSYLSLPETLASGTKVLIYTTTYTRRPSLLLCFPGN